MTIDRPLVLCLGGDDQLSEQLKARNLTPTLLDPSDLDGIARLLQIAEPYRSVVVIPKTLEGDNQEQRLLSKVLNQISPFVARQGLSVQIAMNGANDQHYASGLMQQSPIWTSNPVVLPFGASPTRVAQSCLDHDPGPPWRNIPVEGAALGEGDKILIQRAFYDCESVSVRQLENKTVYKVQAQRKVGLEPVVFLVKIDSREGINIERGNIALACGEYTPFAYYTPLSADRCASYEGRSSLIFHFIDRAILLEDYIKTNSPALAISSLFDGPLRGWRKTISKQVYDLADYGFKSFARESPEQYTRAFEAAQKAGGQPLNSTDLIGRIRARPKIEVRECHSHGDLHCGNIFVRENSVETVLIDFRRLGRAPASRDPAELESSLAFARAEPDPIPEAVLKDLYSPPLFKSFGLSRYGNNRALAIEQLRKQVWAETSEDEYQTMLVLHLLHYARKGNAAAYACAERIVKTW